MIARKFLGDLIGRYLGLGGAEGDANNVLNVKGSGSLFDGGTGSHQLNINKDLAEDTASIVFQTGYSGRAEFGTIGSDQFQMKVSSDGNTFKQALIVDESTGYASLPNTKKPQFTAFAAAGVDDFSIAAAPSFTTTKWSNLVVDTNPGAYDITTGIYTAPETGTYLIYGGLDSSGTSNTAYSALACIPGSATDVSIIHAFGRAYTKSGLDVASISLPVFLTQGQQIKFVRYYFGGTVTVVENSQLPSSYIGALRLDY